MNKVILFSTCIAAAATMAACGGPGAKGKAAADTAAAETKAVPEYTVINNATVDLAGFPQDKDGYYVIFDGKTLNGWRGYGKENVPSRWTIDDGAIKFNGSGGGEAQTGEGGDLLSTGGKQLISFARAVLANPRIFVLDEATSSIDTRTEALIEKGMDRLMAGRTVFVIAHRLSTVRNSKAIMVLEQGSIIERGDHEDLLAQHGRYYQLYTGQAELA